MSFIQCRNENDLESMLEGRTPAFVTEDNRIYDSIEFCDGALYYSLNPATVQALMHLQDTMELMSDVHESNFEDIVKDAEDLRDAYLKAMAAIKFKPIERKEKA